MEAAFESGIFFDVFAVFIEGGCADTVEFAAGEHRFKHVAGVDGAFGFTSTDDGVKFVDEEDNSAIAVFDFFEDGFETFFKFAAVFGAGEEGAHVEAEDGAVLEAFGNVAADDAVGEAFDDGGFTDTGVTDEDRVIFSFTGKDSDDTADFFVTADDGIEFAFFDLFDEVDAVFFEGLEGVFGILRGYALATADFFEGFHYAVCVDAEASKEFAHGAFAVAFEESYEKVFNTDIVIAHGFGAGFGTSDGVLDGLGNVYSGGVDAAGYCGELVEFAVEGEFDGADLDAHFLE